MSRSLTRVVRMPAIALLLGWIAATAIAQNHGGGGPGGGGPGGGMGGGPGPGGGNGFPGNAPPNQGMGPGNPRGGPPPVAAAGTPTSSMRAGLQLGPPGRWWDDKHFAKDLGLRPDQQHRMDEIFNENRSTLITRYQALQEEEGRMYTLSRSPAPDEEALFAEIDRLAQARAALEKVNTHYLLSLRKEMNADQVARLESHR